MYQIFTKCVWAPPLVEAKCCIMQQNNTRFLSGTATRVQFQPWTTACTLKMYLNSATIESLDYITLNLYCQNTVPRGPFPVWVSPSIWSTWMGCQNSRTSVSSRDYQKNKNKNKNKTAKNKQTNKEKAKIMNMPKSTRRQNRENEHTHRHTGQLLKPPRAFAPRVNYTQK